MSNPETPQIETSKSERTREEHEAAINAVVERLKNEGYFRPGESVQLSFAAPDSNKKWIANCDTTCLIKPPVDDKRKERFPADDALYDAFVEAGYRVSVTPAPELGTDEVDGCSYFLYPNGS